MLRIVPRQPLSANVTLQQRVLPAAARGVATPRSNERSRRGLSHLASVASHRIRRTQSVLEFPSGSIGVRKISDRAGSPWDEKSPPSARSDPGQTVPLESPTGNDGAVDGKHGLNPAATAGPDVIAAELAEDLTEDPSVPPDDITAEFVNDLSDNDLLSQLYSPATESETYRDKEKIQPRLDARAPAAAEALAGEHLPPELDSPAAEFTTDPTEEYLSASDGLSEEHASRQAWVDTRGDLAADRSNPPESSADAVHQFDAPSPYDDKSSEQSEQENVTGSSPSTRIRQVSSQPAFIRVSNLPDNITGSMLLNAISIHGPFGKVLEAEVRHLASGTYALIGFTTRPSGESLFRFIRDGKLIIEGEPARCRWHPREYRKTHASWRSRVLVAAMDQDLATYGFLKRLRALSKTETKYPDVVIEPILTVGGWVALVCTFLDIGHANFARQGLTSDGIRVSFGSDPVAVGVIKAYEANLRLGERLMAATLRRGGVMEDQVISKSIAELAQERLEQQANLAPPPLPQARTPSLDPFVDMAQPAYQPTAKRTPLNDSFSDGLEKWERPEDAENGMVGPESTTTAPAAFWPDASPKILVQPHANQQSLPDGNGRHKSRDDTTDMEMLEDIGEMLERFRKMH